MVALVDQFGVQAVAAAVGDEAADQILRACAVHSTNPAVTWRMPPPEPMD